MSRFVRFGSALKSRTAIASAAVITGTASYFYLQPNETETVEITDPAALYYGSRPLRLQETRPVGSDTDRPSATWTPPTRNEMLKEFKTAGKSEREFDLLIVGGGATGAGIALDAASRGLKVGLVERDDFSSGECGDGFSLSRAISWNLGERATGS